MGDLRLGSSHAKVEQEVRQLHPRGTQEHNAALYPYQAPDQQNLDNPWFLAFFPLHSLPHQWGESYLTFNSLGARLSGLQIATGSELQADSLTRQKPVQELSAPCLGVYLGGGRAGQAREWSGCCCSQLWHREGKRVRC